MEIRFRAHEDIYESVVFVLRVGDREIARAECCSGRPLALEHRVTIPVTPQVHGSARLVLDVVCAFEDVEDCEVHRAELDASVDAAASGSFNPVIQNYFNQNVDRASDAKANVALNIENIKLPETDPSRYITPSVFVDLSPTLVKSPARLTLKSDGMVLQLVSDSSVSFGRSGTNTIALRICQADGVVNAKLSGWISRSHFFIERSGGECHIMDGDRNGNKSANGTTFDGMKIPPGKAVRIPSGQDGIIEIGGADAILKMSVRSYKDAMGRVKGFILDRCDGARVRLFAVWKDVPFGDGASILWSGSRWTVLGSDGAVTPLGIGARIAVSGQSYLIMPFRQVCVR